MSNANWLSVADCVLDDFVDIVSTATDPRDYPRASSVESGVVVYSGGTVRPALADPLERRAIQAEWVRALTHGPGVISLKGAFDDTSVVDAASAVFDRIIEEQHAAGGAAGDHFGEPGANDRIWNALEKLALRAPDVFIRYYANDLIAAVAEAWLGPAYQVTSQVNVVNPGGSAQTVHRDYHLGFQGNDVAERFPAHSHRLSPVLTLQGAVAHCDMPLISGPTLYLPHSQKYLPGYLAWRLPQFREYFDRHRVQLPLATGDAVFFNPALFHAAGENRSTIRRMANLLQISSAFGRAMESIDRGALSLAVYADLLKAKVVDHWEDREIDNVIAASAEGYAFPTNLDRAQPIGGLAPRTQAEILTQAVTEEWSADRVAEKLAEHARLSYPH